MAHVHRRQQQPGAKQPQREEQQGQQRPECGEREGYAEPPHQRTQCERGDRRVNHRRYHVGDRQDLTREGDLGEQRGMTGQRAGGVRQPGRKRGPRHERRVRKHRVGDAFARRTAEQREHQCEGEHDGQRLQHRPQHAEARLLVAHADAVRAEREQEVGEVPELAHCGKRVQASQRGRFDDARRALGRCMQGGPRGVDRQCKRDASLTLPRSLHNNPAQCFSQLTVRVVVPVAHARSVAACVPGRRPIGERHPQVELHPLLSVLRFSSNQSLGDLGLINLDNNGEAS